MAKRKKRVATTKKKKDDVDNNDDDIDEPVAKKVAVSSSTILPEDDSSQHSTFSVEGANIGRSETAGGEVGFTSHFWCNYCEFSSDTKKELVGHMRQHMTKCSYCNFSSLSRAEIAKHVKSEHEDEAERTICEVDSSSSAGTEHDMDKDPCSACIFCEFLTYSTEHLEKHTTTKHQGMLPKSVAKMISKQVSARIRKDDAMFYCAISSDSFDKSVTEGENMQSGKAYESGDKRVQIVLDSEPEKHSIDVKPNISSPDPPENINLDNKPDPQTLSRVVTTQDQKPIISENKKEASKADDWRVKVETLYCLSCPYSNVAIEKLKCHALTQHPDGAAAASFTSEATCRLQDLTFYCVRESCSYSNVQCSEYENHLISCCIPKDSLLFGEKQRLKDTIKFIFKCQEKQGVAKSKGFIEFSSHYVSVLQSYDRSSPAMNTSTSQNQITTSCAPTANDNRHYLSNNENNVITKEGNNAGPNHSNRSHISTMNGTAVNNPININNSGPNNLNNGYQSTMHSNVPQTATYQDSCNPSLNNFNQTQTTYGQGNVGQTQSNFTMNQQANNFGFTPTSSSSGVQNSQISNVARLQQRQNVIQNNNFSSQFGNPVQSQPVLNSSESNNSFHQNSNQSINNNFQQKTNAGALINFQQNSNPVSQSYNNSGFYKQEPVSFNVNTNTASSGQQNPVPPPPPQAMGNSEAIVAPSFDSQFPVMMANDSNNQSFIPHQNNQQEQGMGIPMSAMTTSNQPTTSSSNLYPEVQQPKMLDLLSDPSTILLDNDVSVQPWTANTQSQDTFSSQPTSQSFPPPSSLHTPPLPQSDNNQPVFATTNFESGSQQQLPLPPQQQTSNFSHQSSSLPIQQQTPAVSSPFSTTAPSSHNNQSQLPTPVQNPVPPSETVIDLENLPTYEAPISTMSSSQYQSQNTAASAANYVDGSLSNPIDNPSSHDTYQSTGEVGTVPNFLVPSSSSESMPNQQQQQPNSFFSNNNSVPPQSPNHQSNPSLEYPNTPPSQKNVPTGTSKFINVNSPLSPSIYLSGKSPRHQRSVSADNSPMPTAGSPQMVPQFRTPQPMNLNNPHPQPSPNVRQRLFAANSPQFRGGRQRGPRMHQQQPPPQQMVRPSADAVDDDVIVTAVEQGPPVSPRGRGGVPNPSVRGRGVAINARGRGMAPRGRGGMPQSGRGMAPGGRGFAPNMRGRGGMPPSGRGIAPTGRGMAPNARGMNPRGRAGLPMQRGRGGMPRGGRGGAAMPPNMSPQARKPIDVSRHFVDLACVVNANEEDGDEEIQIVSVTPGKGGNPQPKAVDANKFSYSCIHCGKDQGSKEVMKRHIKASHSESLLGAFRNVESGQWLYFCPQLTCEFMTYNDNRLTDHLFACYNLDRNKQLPYDMQSALKNLKSLKIRQVSVQGGEGMGRNQTNPVDLEGQGLRDAFNNNLKNAFDDMVENTMGRQMMRPNQPTPSNQRPPPGAMGNQPQPSYMQQRGALRGPYPPRGTPPRNVRPGMRGPGQMPPGYRQRGPTPHQPRYPGVQGRPRAPNQPFQTRGMAPIRGGPPAAMRGQRPPNRGALMPRPSLATGTNTLGNEQTPIVIDLDADSPGNELDNNDSQIVEGQKDPESLATTPVDTPNTSTPSVIEPSVDSNPGFNAPTASNEITNAPSDQVVGKDASSVLCNLLSSNSPELQTLHNPNNETTINSTVDSHSFDGNQATYSSPSQQPLNNHPLTALENITNDINVAESSNALSEGNNDLQSSFMATNKNNQLNKTSSSTNPNPSADNVQSPAAATTSVRNIPSPSQLLAEMNALSGKPSSDTSNTQQETTVSKDRVSPAQLNSKDGTAPPYSNPFPVDNDDDDDDNDEELVNTILLDKVFAKVPHMPKKLSQRLVLKFKKYAADRGVVITPTSKVIDEFVSKISYKGSHSAPTPVGGQENQGSSSNNQPPQAAQTSNTTTTPAVNAGDSNVSSGPNAAPQPSASLEDRDSVGNQNLSSASASSVATPATPPSLLSNLPQQSIQSSAAPAFQIPANPRNVKNEFEETTSNSAKLDDVIETKVIFAERKLQFKGAFANIIKEKSSLSDTVSNNDLPMTTDTLEKSPQESSENLSENMPSSEQLSNDNSNSNSQLNLDKRSPETSQQGPEGSHTMMIAKTLKKEIDPVSFPSVSKENSIEVKSIADDIVCGHASLEVDIAGAPLSASAFSSKEDALVNKDKNTDGINKGISEINEKTMHIDSSTGTLKFKIKKGIKPRVVCSERKEEEIISNEESIVPADDNIVRRSDRKRKAVKVDYEPDGMDEMDELMSDDDDEYHMESDESYDGSDSEGRARKKAKKNKPPPDPTAFDLATKGAFRCWKCSKVFSRVMFLKRHILKKHKDGLCAIIMTETGIPSKDQPSLLLFCPQSCKYVTSDCEGYTAHLGSCTKAPLKIAEVDYKIMQETFFNGDFQSLGEAIASGSISTKIPVKSAPTPRKKSSSTHPPPPTETSTTTENTGTDVVSQSQSQSNNTNTIVTTATVHHPPPSSRFLDEPPNNMEQMPDQYDDGYYNEDEGYEYEAPPHDCDDPDMYYEEEQFYQEH